MAFKDRLNGIAYTCSNSRFHTDITKGHPHGAGQARGSVFGQGVLPASAAGGYSLWLEYVIEPKTGDDDWFWLMWYDSNEDPTIPLSGVFKRRQIQEMARRLSDFIQVP